MTKMVLFASLLFDVLRFNYKGRKCQDSFAQEDFPQRGLRTLLVGPHQQKIIRSPDVSLQNPRNNIILPVVTVC